MMYPFMQLPDGTNVEHSQVITDKGKQKVMIYFERDTKDRLDAAKCEYPALFWNYVDGFSREEIAHFEKLLRDSAARLPNLGQKERER